MLTVISIFVVYITLINSVILLALLYKKRFNKKTEESSFEKASLIIAFKNEKENLPELIHTLKSQSLSPDNFEVIFVDDYSTDDSFEYLKSLIDEQTNFKVIKNKYEQGKKFALKTGINEAIFDILIFT
ncbi:MAG: glycosyltransferase, partial [Ignavibacteria bacterium]